MTTSGRTALDAELHRLLTAGVLELPMPAGGRTADRHASLLEFGRHDLSVGRLVEAHTDGVAILAEAGRAARPGALYGVWAADRPRAGVRATDTGAGFELNGSKAFCTGVSICDMALIAVSPAGPDGDPLAGPTVLVEVDLVAGVADGSVSSDPGGWSSPAFADTATGTVSFDHHLVTADAVVGEPGWYLERPGFWHGAIGPAAVWAGGAVGLVEAALAKPSDSPHTQANLGALRALEWSLRSMLRTAGDEADASPLDHDGAKVRALTVRHLVERHATEVLDRFGRATGPALLAFDGDVARRSAELALYIRQDHAEADLAELEREARRRPGGDDAGGSERRLL